MTNPKVSVVIPTYQGVRRIVRTLNCLSTQSFKDFEAIVVVDGSTDGTYETLTGISWLFPINIINQANKGRAGARNSGVLAARSEIIVFLDDDLIFDERLLARYYELVNAGHSIVAGAVYPVESERHAEFLAYSRYLNKKWSNGVLERGNLKAPFFMAANAMFKRSVFVELGMFDQRLRDAEDFDLAIKAFENGLSIFFEPDALAGHHLHSSFLIYAERLAEYGKAKHALLGLNPWAGKYMHIANPTGLKSFIYNLFAWRFFVWCIDLGFFRLLPRGFRYRVYDFLLTAYSRKRSKAS